MKYIPAGVLKIFYKGEFPEEELKEEQKFGVHSMKVSVGIRGNEEPEPYRVSAFHFQEGKWSLFDRRVSKNRSCRIV